MPATTPTIKTPSGGRADQTRRMMTISTINSSRSHVRPPITALTSSDVRMPAALHAAGVYQKALISTCVMAVPAARPTAP